MTRTLGPEWPAWLRDIDALLAVHPQYVLAGNTRDSYRVPVAGVPGAFRPTESVPEALQAVLRPSGFDVILVHDVMHGYAVLADDPEEVVAGWAAAHRATGLDLRNTPGSHLLKLAEAIRGMAVGADGSPTRRLALVLDYASRLAVNPATLEPTEHQFFSSCLKSAHDAVAYVGAEGARANIYNPVFWIVEREHDLPAWFTAGNRAVRSIPIPWPDLKERTEISMSMFATLPEAERAQVAREVAGRTDGLEAATISDITTLLQDQDIAPADADDAVRLYKLGAGESPWRGGAVADRIRLLASKGVTSELERRVLGQPLALTKSVDILKRAVLGLSGAHSGGFSAKPRGILFFAGPTGTGKTELAKAITNLVFGTDDALLRFDMSEFSLEQSGDRLIGAPPGYVGFEGGGELTNAVRRRPHSLLLFDEIEKAHALILDKFLQILDDGRLSDGRGTTVHFSETLIVFTSNLGMTKPVRVGDEVQRVPDVFQKDSYRVNELKIRKEIDRFFKEDLNRPELLNRIGDNIVVFDFIRPEVAAQIVDLQLKNIVTRVQEEAGVVVNIDPRALAQIHALATTEVALDKGGRGIGNVLEDRFINPLSRALFDEAVPHGAVVTVVDVLDSDVPEVRLET